MPTNSDTELMKHHLSFCCETYLQTPGLPNLL